MKKDLDLTNFHEILTHRMKVSAAKRVGIDLEVHEEHKQELAEIEEKLSAAYEICWAVPSYKDLEGIFQNLNTS